MGVLDKIKNALFEVEYIEVEEPPKKERKEKKEKKLRKEKEQKENKPIAKKVILPTKRTEKIEDLEEENVQTEELDNTLKEVNNSTSEIPKNDFKFIDDTDLEVDEGYHTEEPEILRVIEEEEINTISQNNSERPVVKERRYHEEKYDYGYNDVSDDYESTATSYDSRESRPYGMDNSYKIPVHEYGGYDRKEEKTYFRPSPIISPIYGILDKNYKKEDVVQKKEVRISSYSRNNVSVDDIRNKAYGTEKTVPKESIKFEVEDNSDDDTLLVDLSDKSKPEVKELTVGDAMEYFQDLGLEYNVDYVDGTKEKPKKVEPLKKEKNEDKTIDEEIIDAYQKVPEVRDDSEVKAKDTLDDDNDNLFDLIDSMYQEDE